MIAEFGKPPESLCNHPPGTHKPLRGTDANGEYLTSSSKSENYSAGTNSSLASCIAAWLEASNGILAAVAGVIQGKKLSKDAITHEFLHRTFNHCEARVLKLLPKALSDMPEWIPRIIEDKPCDICLRADASRLGPSGPLPTDEGLMFLDVHHVNVPELFTGYKTTVGATHAATGFCKTVRVRGKMDCHLAIELIICYFNSVGRPITWMHTDGANDLKGTKVVVMARSKNIRITTTTVASSRKNRQEPQWRPQMGQTRKYLTGGKATYELYGWAWDHAEEGRNLLPSRDPPHDCALGRLLTPPGKEAVKPTGAFRRPWLCLCYPTLAPRLPSGTLVNKMAPQSKRALHLGYVGGRGGSFERLGIEHAKAGYACLLPDERRIEVTSDVRFVPKCFPGLQRTSRGGWAIPDDGIPFRDGAESSEDASADATPTADASEGTTAPQLKEISDDADLEAEDGTGDEHALEMHPGFATEESAPAPSRGGGETAAESSEATVDGNKPEPTPPKPAPVPHYLVPREQWPDYPCDEHGGLGWEVVVVKRDKDWALCKFINARDAEGRPFASEWRKWADLVALPDHAKSSVQAAERATSPKHDQSQPDEPTTSSGTSGATDRYAPRPPDLESKQLDFGLTPNVHTKAVEGSTDPLKEPARPERARRPPDRLEYSAAALSAAHAEALELGFDIKSHRMPLMAYVVNVEHTADRLVAKQFDQLEARGEPMLLSAEEGLRHSFEELAPELQRAVALAMDATQIAEELGEDAPQYGMLRELYAAAMVDGARRGIRVPPLDALYEVVAAPNDSSDRVGDSVKIEGIFDEALSGCLLLADFTIADELMLLGKSKSTSPDIFSERQMRGPEWDTPKSMEIAKIMRLDAVTKVAADDPSIKGLQICDFTWAGRCKRHPDGSVLKYNARCCARGDQDKLRTSLTSNDTTAPVARTSSNLCFDAVGCLRCQHKCDYDVPGAYLQGKQLEHERRLYRPPVEAREVDERGIEILWLSNSPFYGQTDAGAIWNRTVNEILTSDRAPNGCGMERCHHDPSVYGATIRDKNGEMIAKVSNTLYVDDGRLCWDPNGEAEHKARDVQRKMADEFGIEFGPDNPEETHFLGANIWTAKSRKTCTVRASSYIDLMVKRFADGDVSAPKFPSYWSSLPADDSLVRSWEAAMMRRTPASPELTAQYQSLYGALLHAQKFRPEISAAMGLLGSCLTFADDDLYRHLQHVLVFLGRSRNVGITFSAYAADGDTLKMYCDANWNVTRSVTGFCIMLAGAAVVCVSRRQHCITMSTCEAELVALADGAIELLHIKAVAEFLGLDVGEAVDVWTDSKAAYDLCHRFTTSQHSRHIDRKYFKMRELRGAGVVNVKHISGETNPADIFTKILTKQPFDKHRKTVMNLSADDGVQRGSNKASSAVGRQVAP